MARIKVLEVLEATIGGTRKHVAQILRGLDPERFEVHLACSFDRDPGGRSALKRLLGKDLRVVEVPMRRRPSPVWDLRAVRHLGRLMRAERYDLVHTHAAKAGFLGRLAARRAGVPAVLHTPHTFPFERVDTRLAWLYKRLERRAARWADRIVLVAESQREAALDARLCEPERLAVVENGVSLPADEPAVLRQRHREKLGVAATTLAVAFVGRLTPQKDVQTFLDVAGKLHGQMPDMALYLVGTTDDRRYLRSLRPRVGPQAWRVAACGESPSGRVDWSPSLPVQMLGGRPDAAELVAAFDVVVLPSRYEGLPYSLLEAMACAVPVAASAVTGSRDVIRQGRDGVLVSPGDVAGFVAAVRGLLADPAKRRDLGAAARERIAASFSEERFVRGIDELYTSVLRGDPERGQTPGARS